MEGKYVTDLCKQIRDRMREEGDPIEGWSKLTTTNPRLAKLCEAIDDIIDTWAFKQIERMEAEGLREYLKE